MKHLKLNKISVENGLSFREVGEIAGLAPEERLLLEAFRSAFAGEPPRALLCLALGEVAGDTAAHALEGFLRSLRGSARRAFWLPAPSTARVAAQERLLLDLVAATQAGHATLSAALLSWLFPTAQAQAAAVPVRLLSSALAAADLYLPLCLPVRAQAQSFEKGARAFACVV